MQHGSVDKRTKPILDEEWEYWEIQNWHWRIRGYTGKGHARWKRYWKSTFHRRLRRQPIFSLDSEVDLQ